MKRDPPKGGFFVVMKGNMVTEGNLSKKRGDPYLQELLVNKGRLERRVARYKSMLIGSPSNRLKRRAEHRIERYDGALAGVNARVKRAKKRRMR